MIINNQKQAVNLRIKKSLALLVLVIAIGLIYFANVLPHRTYGFSRNQIALAILAIFFIYFLIDYMRNYFYIYYSDTGDKFILRYFSLRPLEDKKNAVEFNKREFSRFEIKKTLFGFNESIIIYRKTTKGIAKYPPVSITAVSKPDREKMLSSFRKLTRGNLNPE
jgi:hypothetical protein